MPTLFYVVDPNLDPTLGVAMGVKVSFYVGAKGGQWSKISHRKLKISISHGVVILALTMLRRRHVLWGWGSPLPMSADARGEGF